MILKEQIADAIDTISVCRTYLEDADRNSGGPFSNLFTQTVMTAAVDQVKFERSGLRALKAISVCEGCDDMARDCQKAMDDADIIIVSFEEVTV